MIEHIRLHTGCHSSSNNAVVSSANLHALEMQPTPEEQENIIAEPISATVETTVNNEMDSSCSALLSHTASAPILSTLSSAMMAMPTPDDPASTSMEASSLGKFST
jgi:hypothetical protein